jgi:phenylalanyl-tRNA synthetase beta subunit
MAQKRRMVAMGIARRMNPSTSKLLDGKEFQCHPGTSTNEKHNSKPIETENKNTSAQYIILGMLIQ